MRHSINANPVHDRYARYLVHEANWTSMATIASRDPIVGDPFANVFSMSDGWGEWSTGVPYIYNMPLELSAMDLEQNPRASLGISLTQTGYCREQGWNDQDPRCGHVILTGNMVKIGQCAAYTETA